MQGIWKENNDCTVLSTWWFINIQYTLILLKNEVKRNTNLYTSFYTVDFCDFSNSIKNENNILLLYKCLIITVTNYLISLKI